MTHRKIHCNTILKLLTKHLRFYLTKKIYNFKDFKVQQNAQNILKLVPILLVSFIYSTQW